MHFSFVLAHGTDLGITHWPLGIWLQSQINKFQTHFNDKYLKYFLWNWYYQVNATTPLWSLVNIGSGNGLVRQAPSHYLSQCWPRSLSPYDVTRPQWVNDPTAQPTKQHIEQSGTKPNLVAKIWLPTLVTICNGLPKLVAKISSHIDHLVNTGLAVGSLFKWLPIKVATPSNQTQFEWFVARWL